MYQFSSIDNMRIAIIEDDESLVNGLSELLKKEDWEVDFFKGSSDFGQTALHLYDVILSDLTLHPIDGRELLNTLAKKTPAELLLMNDGTFKEEDLHNDAIKGLIDKTSLPNVIDKLHYIDVKLRIKKLALTEQEKIEDLYISGSYSIEKIDKSISLVVIKDINETALSKLREFFDITEDDIVLTFKNSAYLSSRQLGIIASFYNILKKRNRKLTYWNETKSPKLLELFNMCQLSKIVPIVDDPKVCRP